MPNLSVQLAPQSNKESGNASGARSLALRMKGHNGHPQKTPSGIQSEF